MWRRAFLRWQREHGVVRMKVKGHKVALREKHLEDAPDDYSWRTDEELARLDATTPLTMSYADFLRYYRDDFRYPSLWSRRFAIDTLDGKHIGNCMYYDIDNIKGQTELGIMIGDRDYWSRGYGTDAVTTLLEHIFANTSLNRVYLHTLEWNTRAQRSFKKAGFQEVKRVSRDRKKFILMDIRRSDWLQTKREATAAYNPS